MPGDFVIKVRLDEASVKRTRQQLLGLTKLDRALGTGVTGAPVTRQRTQTIQAPQIIAPKGVRLAEQSLNAINEANARIGGTSKVAAAGINSVTGAASKSSNSTKGAAKAVDDFGIAAGRTGAATGDMAARVLSGQASFREIGNAVGLAAAKFSLWTAAAAVIGATVGTFVAVANAVADVNDAMIGLQRVTGGTGKEFDRGVASDKIIQNMRDLHVSAKDAGTAVFEMGKAYGNATEAIAASRTVLLASKVAEIDLAQASQQLVAASNAFGLSGFQQIQIVDRLNAAQNSLGVGTAKTLEALSRSAAVTKSAGGSLDQLIARLAVGIRFTGQAPESVARANIRIAQTVSSLKGQQKVIDSLKGSKTGDTILENIVGSDGALKDVDTVFNEISKRFKSLSKTQKDAVSTALTGGRQGGLSSLTFALLEKQQEVQKQAKISANSQGSAAQELKTVLGSIREQVKGVGSELQVLGANLEQSGLLGALGAALVTLKEMLRIVNDLLGVFNDLPDAIQLPIGALAGTFAARGIASKVPTFNTGLFGGRGGSDAKLEAANANLTKARGAEAAVARQVIVAEEELVAATGKAAVAQNQLALFGAEATAGAIGATGGRGGRLGQFSSRAGKFATSPGALFAGSLIATGGSQLIPETATRPSIARGAVAGAGTGAAAGTLIAPGIGTGIGAAVGTLAGSVSAFTEQQQKVREQIAATDEEFNTVAAQIEKTSKSLDEAGAGLDIPDIPKVSSSDLKKTLDGVAKTQQDLIDGIVANISQVTLIEPPKELSSKSKTLVAKLAKARDATQSARDSGDNQAIGRAIEDQKAIQDQLASQLNKNASDLVILSKNDPGARNKVLAAQRLIDASKGNAAERKNSVDQANAALDSIVRDIKAGQEQQAQAALDEALKNNDFIALIAEQNPEAIKKLREATKESGTHKAIRGIAGPVFGQDLADKIAPKTDIDRAIAEIRGIQGTLAAVGAITGEADKKIAEALINDAGANTEDLNKGIEDGIITSADILKNTANQVALGNKSVNSALKTYNDLAKSAAARLGEDPNDKQAQQDLLDARDSIVGALNDQVSEISRLNSLGSISPVSAATKKIKAAAATLSNPNIGRGNQFREASNVLDQSFSDLTDAKIEQAKEATQADVDNAPNAAAKVAALQTQAAAVRAAGKSTLASIGLSEKSKIGLVVAFGDTQSQATILAAQVVQNSATSVQALIATSTGLSVVTGAVFSSFGATGTVIGSVGIVANQLLIAIANGGSRFANEAAGAITAIENGRNAISSALSTIAAAAQRVQSAAANKALNKSLRKANAASQKAIDEANKASAAAIAAANDAASKAKTQSGEDPAVAAQELISARFEFLKALAGGDNVKVAKLDLQEAQQLLKFAKTQAEKFRAQAAIINAQRALVDAFIAEKMSSIDLLLESGAISTDQAVAQLEKLKKRAKGDKDKIDEINKKIQAIQKQDKNDKTFGLPTDILLPSAFELKKVVKSGKLQAQAQAGGKLAGGGGIGTGLSGGAAQVSNTNNIQIIVKDSRDLNRVKKIIGDATSDTMQKTGLLGTTPGLF